MGSSAEQQLRVAVVDDDALFLELVCAILSSDPQFVAFPAASGHELFTILNTQTVDCILLDYNLHNETGLSVKKQMDFRFKQSFPVIMLTGNGQESTVIESFRMGVNDYVPKLGLNPATLLSTIAKVVANHRQNSIARAQSRRIEEAAKIDVVTGLAGQVHLDERMAQMANLAPANRGFYALLDIELVEYVAIVEYFGLETSHAALRAFAEKLKEITGPADLCGRCSGGNFRLIKTFESDPTAFLPVMCKRVAEFLSFPIPTPFGKLDLSPKISIVPNTGGEAMTPSPLWSILEKAREQAPLRMPV